MHRHDAADHLRHDDHAPQVRLDGLRLLAVGRLAFDPRDWHVNHLLVDALLNALIINMLCMCSGFLEDSRDWHVNHHFLNDVFDNSRGWHVNDPLISVLLDVRLRNSLGKFDASLDGVFDNSRDWHVNHPLIGVLLDVLMKVIFAIPRVFSTTCGTGTSTTCSLVRRWTRS